MRKLAVIAALVCAFLAYPSVASAGGWAGSRYEKSDCTYSKETDTLYCEAWFTDETFTTMQFAIPDASCTSTLRLIERTGWHTTTYRGWGFFAGRVPRSENELAGNEDGFTESWRDYVDRDLGCV